MCVGVVGRLPQRLKSTFFEKKKFFTPQSHTLRNFFRTERPRRASRWCVKKKFQQVDFKLWDSQCCGFPKLHFFSDISPMCDCVALKGRPFKYYICIYVDLKHLTFSYLILQSSYNWSNFFQGQFGSSFRYSRVENGICCAARATKSHVKQTFGKSISGTNFYFRFRYGGVRPHNELKYGRKSIN